MGTRIPPAEIVLVSNALYTGLQEQPQPGFVAIRGNIIVAVGPQGEWNEWVGPATKVYQLGDQLVIPGIHDNHVFFTGYMSLHHGIDLSDTTTVEEAASLLLDKARELPDKRIVCAYGWDRNVWGRRPEQKILDELFPDRPVVAINRYKNDCWMNQLAIDKYHFDPDHVSAEARALLLKEMLSKPDVVEEAFLRFCDEMLQRGVTSIKDIQFDDSYGLSSVLEHLNQENRLPLRVHFALEPVLEPMNIPVGLAYQKLYNGNHLHFQGFKLMVDGVVADHTGDMLEPYADMPGVKGLKQIDYGALEEAVLTADDHGLKVCLTAEGDAAIRKCVDIFEKCRSHQGRQMIRHSISDLEYPHPDDLKRMAELGIFAEVYAQVLLLNPSHGEAYMAEVVGPERESRFYNYRAMLDEGVQVTIGTDLPLFMTSVPDSIYAAHARRFPDGSPEGGWYPECGMTLDEILKGWTIQGATHCMVEDQVGTLEVGKLADIAVFDRNLFTSPMDTIREAKVILTLVDGVIKHDTTVDA